MRSSGSRDICFLEIIWGAGIGVFIGAEVGLAVGAVTGAAVGWYNEATLVGDEYEELFIGFSEYSVYGMGIWCALICAIYGAIAGAVSGAIAWASRRRMAGLAVGAALPLVLWAATDLFHDGRKQAGFVWFAGMLAGSFTAGLLCANRRSAPQPLAERLSGQ